MSTTEAHTPTPWYVYRSFIPGTNGHEYLDQIREVSTNNYVCGAGKADAARIVHCVNSFDALTEANKKLSELVHGAIRLIDGDCPLTETNCDDWLRRARAQLAKAQS